MSFVQTPAAGCCPRPSSGAAATAFFSELDWAAVARLSATMHRVGQVDEGGVQGGGAEKVVTWLTW